MIATTESAFGDHKHHRPSPCFRFTIFSCNIATFRSIARNLVIYYETIEDQESPYYSTFEFCCDSTCLSLLIQKYVEEGYPFLIENFDIDDQIE